jgi:hypothetical protein
VLEGPDIGVDIAAAKKLIPSKMLKLSREQKRKTKD